MDKQTLLITGATGRSGRLFLKRISEERLEQYTYKVIMRASSNTSVLDSSGLAIEKVVGDLTDEKFLLSALKGVDEVLHIAGIKYSPQLARAAINNNVKRLILVHTTGIYSKFKAAGEEYIKIEEDIAKQIENKKIQITILRPTMIFGSLNDHNISVFIKMVDLSPVIPVVDHARFALQPVHQNDLANAYYDVLISPSKTKGKNYTLSGSYAIDLIDILITIKECLGKKNKPIISLPFCLVYMSACVLYAITLGKIDIREKVQRLIEPRAYSHEVATKDFGYSPQDFYIGLKKEIEDYKKAKR